MRDCISLHSSNYSTSKLPLAWIQHTIVHWAARYLRVLEKDCSALAVQYISLSTQSSSSMIMVKARRERKKKNRKMQLYTCLPNN